MDIFQAVWNFTAIEHPEMPRNPAEIYRKQGGRNKEVRRKQDLKPSQIPHFWHALNSVDPIIGLAALVGFAATIPLANWMIGSVGTICVPDGPCMIPVAPGIMAPSGVLMVGLAFVLRDIVQRELGAKFALGAIAAGAILSGFVAAPALVVASIAAFAISETADFAVTHLFKRRV